MPKLNYIPLFFLLAFGAVSCNNSGEKNDFSGKPVSVTLATASAGQARDLTETSGYVEAVKTAQISTRMMGTITRIFVNIGDGVHQGQLLFTVNSSDLEAKDKQASAGISGAEAALILAQKDYRRFQTLFKENSATEKELDNVRLQYEAAEAQLDAARQMKNEVGANINYARITAPFSGVITQKLLDAGSLAAPGMPVLSLEQPEDVQIATTVSEKEIDQIKTGAKAKIRVDAANKTWIGTVTRISPSSDKNDGQYLVKLSLPKNNPSGVLPGMYAHISFEGKAVDRQADNNSPIMIPIKSLVTTDDLKGIYTVSANNTALLRWLRLGKIFGDQVEVLSGLQPGEKFIETADSRLYNGVPVKTN